MSEALEAISLASQSPRRRQLLESLGLQVVVVPSTFREDETAAGGDPGETALRFALGKAEHASRNGPPVLIAADTVVAIDGEVLGKPRDGEQATAMLHKLSGRVHRVYTGFAVMDRTTARTVSGVESTEVQFVALRDRDIAAYVASGDPLDKAGAYGIQGRGGLLVSSISGDFYTVMGLPLARVGAALRELGYEVLQNDLA